MANPEIALSTISSLFNVGTNNAATTLKNSALAPSLPATNQALLTSNLDGTLSWNALGLSSVGIDATLTSALSIVPTTGTNYALKSVSTGTANSNFLRSNGTWSSPVGTLSKANSSFWVLGQGLVWSTPNAVNSYRHPITTNSWTTGSSLSYNYNNLNISVADAAVNFGTTAGFTVPAGTYQVILSLHAAPSPGWPGNGTAGAVMAFDADETIPLSIVFNSGGAVYMPWAGYPSNTDYKQQTFMFFLNLSASKTFYTYLYCPTTNNGITMLSGHNTFIYIEKLG